MLTTLEVDGVVLLDTSLGEKPVRWHNIFLSEAISDAQKFFTLYIYRDQASEKVTFDLDLFMLNN